MFLLAISGGPDSMFLLHKYRNKKIIVAHVNYNKRKDSSNDQAIVENFCKENNIKIEVLNLKEKAKGNFQSWARKKRYDFFKKIYKKYNCTKLITGHHKDDFVETAIMQQASGRIPRFYGIKEKNHLFDMFIYRPFIYSYFKDEIIKKITKLDIKYAIDSTNKDPIYERNKVRLDLKKKTLKEKQNLFEWFILSNKILEKKFKRVDKKYKKIKESGFDLNKIRMLKKDINEVLFELVNDQFTDIKLSSKKIESLWQFIKGKEGNKKFILNSKNFITKKSGKLIYNKNRKNI